MKETAEHRVFFIVLALIPFLFSVVVSCSSTPRNISMSEETTADWIAVVDKTIPEPDRAARLKELGLKLIGVANSIHQDIEAFNQDVMTLNENYGATQEEFQKTIDAYAKRRNPKFTEYRDLIFAMRSDVSADEWDALTK